MSESNVPIPPSYNQQQVSPPGYAGPEDPGKTLGIVGLVLCFVFSLAGLIVSIIAKRRSTAAGFKNTPANVGVILGWIFTIMGLLYIVFAIIIAVMAMNNGTTTKTY